MEMDYFQRMERRINRLEAGVPEELGDKSYTRPFADMIGVRTPKLLFQGSLVELLEFSFPEEFVLKPRYLSTSKGVYLLRKSGRDFESLTTGESLTLAQLERTYMELAENHFSDPRMGEYLVEELLRDDDGTTPPVDIRAYMFQGVCGFVLVEDHMHEKARATYFNGDFSPMLDVAERFGVAERATHLEEIIERRAPSNATEILAVANRISIAVPSAFCRVDMYNTGGKVYLGEITFFPGTFYYRNRKLMSRKEAERLGELWAAAEGRLHGSLLVPAPNQE
ncbi:ATP-grasp fold amidoligase family protein [Neomicrococcus lactis]